ncbi:MAG: exodeoxyribonuclease VII large subunit [Acidobacteriota bacterium]|nr:exodeoxyribonuclease VII large subunit [Acidobacteriota bacterium]
MTSPPATSQPISVSDAIGRAKATVEAMPTLLVTGEVSGFRGPARTGHCYFQLKDDSSAMDAIVWRGIHQASGVQLRDGVQLLVTGQFQVYAPTGRLSFVARSLQVSGEGLLRQQVAALARRLEAEGLMDPSRKRRIPQFCTRVAVVTSPTGSVIDDVKRTLARRNPLVELLVSGCAVQGEGAAAQVARALVRAAAAAPDAILLVRGGGSYEDLMTFNDEALARAVAACPVPVVTGIGHEPDTCICDMVADRRCSTPTAAAESVAPAFDEIARQFHEREARLARAMGQALLARGQAVDALSQRSRQAMRSSVAALSRQVASLAAHRCLQDPRASLDDRRAQLELSAQRLHDAAPRVVVRLRGQTEVLRERLRDAGPRMLRQHEALLVRGAAQLDALSPLKVLGRGYAIVRDEGGHVVARSAEVAVGSGIAVLLGEGGLAATVTAVFDEDGMPGAPTGAGTAEGKS